MRKVFVAVIALAAIVVADSSAEAARRQRRVVRRRVVVQRQQPINQRVGAFTGGFFARLMELERRKNEWLFGRR